MYVQTNCLFRFATTRSQTLQLSNLGQVGNDEIEDDKDGQDRQNGAHQNQYTGSVDLSLCNVYVRLDRVGM